MSLPIKTLPIVERWDCSSCGSCCRGTAIPLRPEELKRIKDQNWKSHPDFAGVKVICRGCFGKPPRLATRDDGSCVFLMPDNRCQIHAEHGSDAKPIVCQMFPLQLVPQHKRAVLTTRRSCPSAAADAGSELEEHLRSVRRLAEQGSLLGQAVRAPAITRRFRGTWSQALLVTSCIERFLTDENFPLVRRLVHAVQFCGLLDKCKLKKLDESQFAELLQVLEDGIYDEAGALFRDRQPPRSMMATLFRQVAAEYLRLHSEYRATDSWYDKLRLTRAALLFARGRGTVPCIHSSFPEVTFDELEQPLGHLGPEFQRPLVRLYEANACSLQYLIAARPGWSIVESLRAFALAYPVASWILRWISHGREPTIADAIEMVTMIDRGQGHRSLIGKTHRRRVSMIARIDDLERIIIWYV